jgi:hypothetical protein
MMPGNFPLTIYRSDTARWSFTLWSDAAKTIPTDLTGATAAAHIQQANTSLKPPVVLTCTIAPPNTINMILVSDVTVGTPARGHQGRWDMQVTFPNGEVQTVLAGTVDIVGDVTRIAS